MIEAFQEVTPKPESAVFRVFYSSILLVKKQGQEISVKEEKGKGGKKQEGENCKSLTIYSKNIIFDRTSLHLGSILAVFLVKNEVIFRYKKLTTGCNSIWKNFKNKFKENRIKK